jgi:hypothetical protein
VVAAVVLAAAGLAGFYALRVTSWAVMTDELQVVRLAESIARTLSPVPSIHGEYYGALSQLYPVLIAPFFGALSAPSAATAAHALNAILLPSAAWPAFLLARSVSGSRAAGLVAAALTAFTPWLVLTSTLLTENAAYPAFVWALFLCHRALVDPSSRRDLAALGALLLAFFARTQLFVLAVALPAALVLHEVGFALARPTEGSWLGRARRGLSSHPVLAAAYGLGGVGAAALAALGSLDAIVGNYAIPFTGDMFPPGIMRSAAAHLDQVVIGCGVLPFALAVAWASAAILRPERKEAHAFAVLLAVLVPLLTFEVASFDLRFTPEAFIQDRYLFYLVPVFAIGCGAALVQRTRLSLRVGLLAVVTGAFAWLLQYAEYRDDTIIFWASPAAAFHPALVTAGAFVGLSAEALIVIAMTLLATAVALLMWRTRHGAALLTSILVAAFGAFEAGYIFNRFADPTMTRPAKLGGVVRDWIDKAVPAGNSVALVPNPHDTPEYWWEAELWNEKVDRVLRVAGSPTFTPFPADQLSIRFESGLLRGPQPSDFLVVSLGEKRFHILEAATVVLTDSLRLVRVDRPYRLDWATRGISADGWTSPGRPAVLRFYGHGGAGRRTIVLILSSSREAAVPLDFTLFAEGAVQRGSVDPGGARPPLRFSLCVPPGGHVDASLRTRGEARIPDGRVVGLHIDQVAVMHSGPCEPDQVSSR